MISSDDKEFDKDFFQKDLFWNLMKLIIFNSQKCKLNLKGKQSQLVAPYWTAYLSEV